MNNKIIKKIKHIKCYLIGHKWVYNFPLSSMPNKAICKNCYAKSKLNLETLNWENVSFFENEKRTNKELIDKWF